ncbi:MAG: hypothetical protein JSR46_01810 [Verrucomicrobia bacterium]|nr:hypothetical protein [Verrucomicrobiota bacterium]
MKHLSSIISSSKYSALCSVLIGLYIMLIGPLAAEEPLATQAFKEYEEGERASDPEVRQKAFNDALTHYLQAEPAHPSGELCFNIANTYFQLGEYGFAILYYYKAQKQLPRDQGVAANLKIALQKAGLPAPSSSFIQDYLLYFHNKLSDNEKALLVLVFFFGAFGFASGHIWQPQTILRTLSIACAILGSIIFISFLWSEYFAPPEAVIVKPTEVRLAAGEQYAAVAGNPGIPGTKVEVISMEKEGNWMKVRLPSGEVGYIAKDNVRVV